MLAGLSWAFFSPLPHPPGLGRAMCSSLFFTAPCSFQLAL